MDALISSVIVCLVSVASVHSLTTPESVSFKSDYTYKDTSTELNAGEECGMSAFIFAYPHPPSQLHLGNNYVTKYQPLILYDTEGKIFKSSWCC